MLPDEEIDRSTTGQREFTMRMWQIYRDYVIQEDALMGRRLGNLLTHQAFLLAAAGAGLIKVVDYLTKPDLLSPGITLIFLKNPFTRWDLIGESFVVVVALIGLSAAWASRKSIKSGELALKTLSRSWEVWKLNLNSAERHDWEEITLKVPAGARRKHQFEWKFDPFGLPGVESAGSDKVRDAGRHLSDAGHLPILFMILWTVLVLAMALLALGRPLPPQTSKPAPSAGPTLTVQQPCSSPTAPPATPSRHGHPRNRSAAGTP